ncbi:galaxin isoform X2 [Patella vulgata]|uniref:galaxin isoform X2 n=1 Tax=Patella vulgata TaxID=6465 RepID=UPI00217F4EA5|nr:galaxin isoform X2 [Patella vulgata]
MELAMSSLLNTFILLIIGNLTASLTIPCSEHDDLEQSEKIDSDKQQCCNGVKQMKQPGTKCCYRKATFYFPTHELCCGGRLLKRTEGRSESCCDGQKIDDEINICCNNQIFKLEQGLKRQDAACCGHRQFDMNKQFCCDSLSNKVKGSGCCNGSVIDTASRWCDINGRALYKDEMPCGGKTINLRTHSCCRDVINAVGYLDPYNILIKDKHHGCCGTVAYNVTTDRCCDYNHTIPKHTQLQCCGAGYFNVTTQLCCGGVVYEKRDGLNHCCGGNPFNSKTHGCCGSGRMFDTKTQKCCRGLNSTVQDKAATCCGSKHLNNDSVCCRNAFPVKKNHLDETKCCVSMDAYELKGEPYNNERQGCYHGNVYTKGKQRPCGKDFIDPTTHVCCGLTSYRIPDGEKLACCGVDSYNINKQLCCFDSLNNISPKEGKCCGSQAYPKEQLPGRCAPQITHHPTTTPIQVSEDLNLESTSNSKSKIEIELASIVCLTIFTGFILNIND